MQGLTLNIQSSRKRDAIAGPATCNINKELNMIIVSEISLGTDHHERGNTWLGLHRRKSPGEQSGIHHGSDLHWWLPRND